MLSLISQTKYMMIGSTIIYAMTVSTLDKCGCCSEEVSLVGKHGHSFCFKSIQANYRLITVMLCDDCINKTQDLGRDFCCSNCFISPNSGNFNVHIEFTKLNHNQHIICCSERCHDYASGFINKNGGVYKLVA